MGVITKAIEKRYSLADLDNDMDTAMFGQTTATGMKVSETTALNITAYFHGQRLLAETLGIVPLVEYRRVTRGTDRQGKERATGERLYTLMHDSPNPEMDAISFKSALMGHAIGWGNAFAEIEWNTDGEVEALWPLNVSRMKVGRDDRTKELIYVYTTSDGRPHVLPSYRILHIPAYGFDGVIGYDSIYLAREMLGLNMALQEHGARFFGNGARPGVVLTHPNKLTKEAKAANIAHWQEQFGGLTNVNRTAILDEGITLKEIGIPPENSQYLETRTFGIQDIGRLLNLTPHKLMELSHATFSNIEHQDLEFNKYSMGPWYRRWEQACNRKMILPDERAVLFFEFLEDALLRADTQTRMAAYKEMFYMGSLSPNDIREKENMNPIADPGGDKYYIQQNMVPMDMAGKQSGSSVYIGNRGLGEVVKRIAEREKSRILRAAGEYDEVKFRNWKEDFYRDFPEFIKAQVKPALGDEAGAVDEFVSRYVESSRAALGETEPGKLADVLMNWEEKKTSSL